MADLAGFANGIALTASIVLLGIKQKISVKLDLVPVEKYDVFFAERLCAMMFALVLSTLPSAIFTKDSKKTEPKRPVESNDGQRSLRFAARP